jgi:hypothetical protein
MHYAICTLSIVPVRAEPGDRSEMVSQLLFGDLMETIDANGGWYQVKTLYDGYTGWIDAKQCRTLDHDSFEALRSSEVYLVSEPVAGITDQLGNHIRVVAGSALPNLNNHRLAIAGETYHYRGQFKKWEETPSRDAIIGYAMMYAGAPYLWGGKSPFGIDCSGLTQMVFRLSGIPLKRDARQQVLQGTPVSFLEEAEPGDLAFFDDPEGNIIHTGIIIGPDMIIHASGQVRIDSIDHQGIYNHDTRTYTHTLRLIRNML